MKLLGISGSIRKDSYNTKLLRAAAEFLPQGVTINIIDGGELPLYNSELDQETKPEAVGCLLRAIGESDGLLIATPEYNYSIPGVLKNAIDWASRPAYKSVLARKPAGIFSVSPSAVGGARVQVHLRDVLSSTLTQVFPAPHFLVPLAKEKFDEEGRLVDEGTRVGLDRYVREFVKFVEVMTAR